MRTRIRPWPVRFAVWLTICAIAAAPSFYVATRNWDDSWHLAAMALGILAWVIAYTIASGTRLARRLQARPRMRRTLRIGYGTRMALSILFPLGLFVDLWSGFPSVTVGELLLGEDESPAFVLVTTIVQGAVMNVGVLVYMAVVLGVQRVFGGPEPPYGGSHCADCGYDLRATAKRCPECGAEVEDSSQARKDRARAV